MFDSLRFFLVTTATFPNGATFNAKESPATPEPNTKKSNERAAKEAILQFAEKQLFPFDFAVNFQDDE